MHVIFSSCNILFSAHGTSVNFSCFAAAVVCINFLLVQVSWNISYLGINLLGVDIFMSFVIHSTLILRNPYSLFHNLSHNQ